MNGVNIFLADGFEDIEALGTYDVLQRAGIKAELVAISDDPFVTSSHGITLYDFSRRYAGLKEPCRLQAADQSDEAAL